MNPEKQRFIERLAWYLMGIAIGLVLLGMFWSARQRAAKTAGEAGGPASLLTPGAPSSGGPAAGNEPRESHSAP